jgi:acyl-CoA reductase-like NAD-dependent aldehyde dehydrogenase
LIDVVDPATGRLLAQIEDGGAAAVEDAVAAAEAARAAWAATPIRERAERIRSLADRVGRSAEDLARLDTLQTGNPITAMRADIAKGCHQLEDAAALALAMTGQVFPLPGLHYTTRAPWGVVGRMVTWNHPTMFACARLGSALVAGNCVVLKPSELAPLSALVLAEFARGILPEGVVSVVLGGPSSGEALVRHPAIQRISFTGSTVTALRIQATAAGSGRIKALTFELGGKNPLIVCPDVDLDEAATAAVRGMNFTRVQGQSCGATSRVLVHEAIAGPFVERIVDRVRRIRLGPPMAPDTEMGSMISRAARDRCLAAVEEAVARGATIVAGGTVPSGEVFEAGAYLEPTVLTNVAARSELAREEIFGPVLAISTWETEEEAIALANGTRYGLTAAVWTQDIDRALRIVEGLEAGYVWVNDVETRFPAVPFGGWRDSGLGLEHGLEEILSFTRLKAVNIRVRDGRGS